MASRLEVYAVDDGPTVGGFDPLTGAAVAAEVCGFVSASDEDEERLAALLQVVAGRTALDAQTLSTGRIANADLATVAGELGEIITQCDDELERNWAGALREAIDGVSALSRAAAWRMRYDRGGSVDDGPDEFPTSWSVTTR